MSFVILIVSCSKSSPNDINNSSGNTGNIVSNIYVSGMEVSGLNFIPVYWKNGIKTQLSNTYCYTYDIFVSGKDVYVVGFEGLNTHYPVLWKNGIKTQLSSNPGEAESVFVSGSDVYVCGTEYLSSTNSGQTVAFLWKNGVKTRYETNSGATCVFVNGYDVFVAGNSNGRAVYWRNGVGQNLYQTTSSTASSVFVEGSDFYMTGKDYINGLPVLWRSTFTGASHSYTQTPLSTKTTSIASSIFVSGSNTYISGFEGGACYWKNGVRTQLSTSSLSTADKVFVFGNDFYIAGRGADNLTAGYWKNGVRTELSFTAGSYATSIFVN